MPARKIPTLGIEETFEYTQATFNDLVNIAMSRTTYLQWVETWKKNIAKLEEQIRAEKRAFRSGYAPRESKEYQIYVFDQKNNGQNDLETIWGRWYADHYMKAKGLKAKARECYYLRRIMKMVGHAARLRNNHR